jgi:hypothetical protein
VKTRWSGSKFDLGIKAEEPAKPGLNEWFVLVWTHGADGFGQRPDYYVVPRDHVSALTYMGHRAHLAKRDKHGGPHKDTARRFFEPDHFEGYREAWDWLERPPRKVPWRLQTWLWDHVDRYGLPEGHPGLGRRPNAY